MKTNKHTLDFLIRICLYTLPIWLLGLSAINLRDSDFTSNVSTTYDCSFNFYQRNLGSWNSGINDYFDSIEISFDTYNYLLNNSTLDDETGISTTNFVVYFKALTDLPISDLILGPSNSHLQFFLNYYPQYNFYSIDIIPNFYISYTINNYVYGTDFYYGDYDYSDGIFYDGYLGSENYVVPLNNYFINLDYSLTYYDVFTGGFNWNLTDIDGNPITLQIVDEMFDYDLPLFSVSSVEVSSTITYDYFNFNVEFNNVIGDCCSIPYLKDIYEWFNIHLLDYNTPLVLRNVWALVFYWIYCEFIILIKNVLVFIFFVANRFIERGLNVGKD